MIHISLDEVRGKIPNDWFATADKALADVEVIADAEERAKAINTRAHVWS